MPCWGLAASLTTYAERAMRAVQTHAPAHHRVAVADASGMRQQQGDQEGDMGRKYTKRSSGLRRTLQRFMPALFQPSLPVTTKWASPTTLQPQGMAQRSVSRQRGGGCELCSI